MPGRNPSIFQQWIVQLLSPGDTSVDHELHTRGSWTVRSYFTSRRNGINPFVGLPDTVLARIFIFAANTSTFPARERHVERSISRVCANWRRISLQVPELWTFIWLESTPASQFHPLVSEYLRRSGDGLIDLDVHISSVSMVEELLSILTENSARWRSISICCSSLALQDKLLSPNRRETHVLPLFPSLRYFSLITLENIFDPDYEFLMNGGLNKKNVLLPLTPASLNTIRIQDQGALHFQYPVNGITTLHIDQSLPLFESNYLPRVVPLSPHLVNLSLYGSFTFSNFPVLDLPNLISLRCCGSIGLGEFLFALDAPLLGSFTMKNLKDGHIRRFMGSKLLARWNKFSGLNHLTLDNAVLSRRMMCMLLIVFNSITRFDYINAEAEDVLSVLSGNGMEAELPLPFLGTFSIHSLSPDSKTQAAGTLLSHLITSRSAKANRPLAHLRVHSEVLIPTKMLCDVEVTRWSEVDPWPNGREYPDLYDPFMALCKSRPRFILYQDESTYRLREKTSLLRKLFTNTW